MREAPAPGFSVSEKNGSLSCGGSGGSVATRGDRSGDGGPILEK
jgi:hypothetical protein